MKPPITPDAFRARRASAPYRPDNDVIFINDLEGSSQPRIHEQGGGDLKSGEVYFANISRFEEQFYSEPLTMYGVGYKDPSDLQGLLNFLAPRVPCNERFEYKVAINAEEFLSETDDVRAIGADFKRVEFTGSLVNGRTLNKGLTYIQDLSQVSLNNLQWQQQRTAKLIRRIWRNEVRRAIALLQAAATQQPLTWDTSAGKNADQDVNTYLKTATDASGIRKNRVLYGDSAFEKRNASLGAQNNAGGYAGLARDDAMLARFLRVDEVRVSRERYQSSAAAKSELLGSNVLLWFAEDGVDTEDPTDLKRFVASFSSAQGGGDFRVYVQQINAKQVAITVEHNSQLVVTSPLGITELVIS
jgi:hypothetical protein